MNKKILILSNTILISSALASIPANAITTSIKENQLDKTTANIKPKEEIDINEKLNELFEKNQTDILTKTFIAKTTDENIKAGDPVMVEYIRLTKTVYCTNLRTGKKFSCKPDSSYVGYGYANSSGAVGVLQGLFNAMNAGLVVDGLFGPKTHDSILRFQRKYSNVLTVDGIAGPKTFNWAVFVVFDSTPASVNSNK